MKRDLSVVDEEVLGRVKPWIHNNGGCPFYGDHHNGRKCKALFPKLEPYKSKKPITNNLCNDYCCPCGQFGLAYVTRIAKQIVAVAEGEKHG